MPQATDEQRALMKLWFGDFVNDHGPMTFLESHGFKLLPGWLWRLPTPAHSVSCYEAQCLQFLIDEWDFGDLDSGYTVECLCGKKAESYAKR